MSNEIHAPSRHDEFLLLLIFLLEFFPSTFALSPRSPYVREFAECTWHGTSMPAYPGWSMRCWAPRPHSPPPLLALLSPPRLSTGLNNINYARRRGTRARDRIYIYTFAHSGVRQVSNAIINYPTVFCYRACASFPLPPVVPLLCILHSQRFQSLSLHLQILLSSAPRIRIESLLFRGGDLSSSSLFLVPRREDKFLDRWSWKFKFVGANSNNNNKVYR